MPRGGERQYSDDDLVAAIQAFADTHGRAPTSREASSVFTDLPHHDTYVRRFGSWNAALEAAGYNSRPQGAPSQFSDVSRIDATIADGGFAEPAPIQHIEDRDWNDADVGDRMEAYADAVASVGVVEQIGLRPGGAVDAVKVKLPYGTTVDGRLLKPALDLGLGVASLGTHYLTVRPGSEVHD